MADYTGRRDDISAAIVDALKGRLDPQSEVAIYSTAASLIDRRPLDKAREEVVPYG